MWAATLSNTATSLLLILLCLVLAACEPQRTSHPVKAPAGQIFSSGTASENLFPLVDGYLLSYVTEGGDGSAGMLIARLSRKGPMRGGRSLAGEMRNYEYTADGIRLVSDFKRPIYVLKQPLAVGTTWLGEHGGEATIIAVDKTVDVPAGRFTGCVEVVEMRGGDRPLRAGTTYCPGVGVVVLELSTASLSRRVLLKSHGPPVDIGPSGVRVLP